MSITLRSLVFILLASSLFAQTKIREGSQTMGALPATQGGVPSGGTTEQVLSKISGTDYSTHWVDPSGGVSAFIGLSDVPHSYVGEEYKIVQVNGTGDGLRFSTQAFPVIPQTFTDLNDVPANYVGAALKLVRVNAVADGLEFFTLPTPTSTPTSTPTATATNTPTPTPSATSTPSATPLSIFKTISVSGQSDVVADSDADTLTLVAGNSVIVTTDASTDAITIAVATPTATATFTPTPTATATATASSTATATSTPTATPTATAAAPADAHYVTTQSESGLSNEFSLGSLASGILKQAVSAGVSTPAIAGSSDVIGLFSSCSGTQYLGADGACHSAGSGSVTSVGLSSPNSSITLGGTNPVTTSGTISVDIANSVALPGNPTTTTQASSDNSTRVATTAYVTTGISNAIAGVNPAVAVQAATTAASDTSGFTYSNGVGGIGATLTGPTANVAVTIDGYTFTALGQRLLVKNDTQSPSGAFNGVYYVTTLQAIAIKPVLTRALDYDMPSDINNTGAVPVVNGTVNTDTSWLLTSSVATVGTDPLTYVQFSINPTTIVTTSRTLTIDGVTQDLSANRTWSEDHSVTFVVDGAGIVLSTGTKNPIKVPFGGTLQGWTMTCKPSGSVTADIYRAADGAGLPVTSIVGGSGTKPAIATNVENSSTSFTSWTSTTLTAKDNLAINLSGITTATYVQLTLYFK